MLRNAIIVVGLAAAGVIAVVATGSVQESADGACAPVPLAPPAGLCDGVTALQASMPPDVAHSPDSVSRDDAQRMFDCLSWQTFVALNWPANGQCRGTPDTDQPFSS